LGRPGWSKEGWAKKKIKSQAGVDLGGKLKERGGGGKGKSQASQNSKGELWGGKSKAVTDQKTQKKNAREGGLM